jgi:FK506-binding protein 14
MFKTLLASTVLALAFAESGLEKVTTFMPESCDTKTKSGDFVQMEYTGRIAQSSETGNKGEQFDSSAGRRPFEFELGARRVIPGWDLGLQDMCVGEKRTLTIPPDLGYGDEGAGDKIPGGATLEFDVELLAILDGPPAPPNIWLDIDTNEDGKLDEAEIAAFFDAMGQPVPDGLWDHEDQDKDGFISWQEFGGPKGDSDPTAQQ